MTTLQKRPTKQAILWLLFLGPFFFLVYNLCNWWTAQRADVTVFAFDWEQHIPFIPWLIWPYMSIDLFFAISVFICKTKRSLNQHVYRIITAIIISAIGFLLFPLRFSFSMPPVDGLSGLAFKALLSFDKPFNQAPSLHISLLMILWVQYAQVLKGMARRAMDIWFFLIFISVVFVYQHHVIDVITGFIVGIICLYLFPEDHWAIKKLAKHNRLTLRYGRFSLLLLIVAIVFKGIFWLLIWPAIALFIVAIAYNGLGASVFQKNSAGKQSWPARLLLTPFISGARLSAKRYNQNLAPYSMITDNIAIGGIQAPESKQWDAILDMTSEFEPASAHPNYHSLPVLDLTTPQPNIITAAISWLSRQPVDAKICIHCALGLSRSATVMAAWLVHTGHAKNASDAFLFIQQHRPIVWKAEHEHLIDQTCTPNQ